MKVIEPEIEHKVISPAWLKSKGFSLYIPGCENDFENFPYDLDIQIGQDDLCYLENELNRKRFCIVLTPHESDGTFGFEIYIQDDIGCGFVSIPNQFCEMTEYHFSLLYEAIRRKKL